MGLPEEWGVFGRAFTDFGSSGQLSPTASFVEDTGTLRMAIGTGVSWISPFGPLGVDLAFPVIKEDFDIVENFRVNFGTRF
jgi:outer membrane protein insertion porin family